MIHKIDEMHNVKSISSPGIICCQFPAVHPNVQKSFFKVLIGPLLIRKYIHTTIVIKLIHYSPLRTSTTHFQIHTKAGILLLDSRVTRYTET